MELRTFLIGFVIFDAGFLCGYLLKVFLLNRYLLKKGIKPKDFLNE